MEPIVLKLKEEKINLTIEEKTVQLKLVQGVPGVKGDTGEKGEHGAQGDPGIDGACAIEYDAENEGLIITNGSTDKADVIVTSAEGSIAAITDGAPYPVTGLSVAIEPVQAGSGDPAPDNIRPITGWTSATVTRTGKNLFPYETIPAYSYAWYSGSTALADATQPMFVKGGAKYAISATQDLDVVDTVLIRAWKKDGTILEDGLNILNMVDKYFTTYSASYMSTPKYYTIQNIGTTVHKPFCVYIEPTEDLWLDIRMKANGGTGYDPIVTLFNDETYEPYQSQQVTIALGQTVYGATVDVKTGTLTVDYGFVEFDGSNDENWTFYSSTYKGFMIPKNDMKDGTRQNGLANWLVKNSGTSLGYWLGVNSHYIYIVYTNHILGDDITVEAWRSYLAGNPLQLVYPLANSQTYQLTPQQLSTLLGENHIFADTGDVSVEYRADTKLYIDKKIAELQALILQS